MGKELSILHTGLQLRLLSLHNLLWIFSTMKSELFFYIFFQFGYIYNYWLYNIQYNIALFLPALVVCIHWNFQKQWLPKTWACVNSRTFLSRMWQTEATRHPGEHISPWWSACSQWDVQHKLPGRAQRGDRGVDLLSTALFVTHCNTQQAIAFIYITLSAGYTKFKIVILTYYEQELPVTIYFSW